MPSRPPDFLASALLVKFLLHLLDRRNTPLLKTVIIADVYL